MEIVEELERKSHSHKGGGLFLNELWVHASQAVSDSVEIPNLALLVPSPSRERDRVRVLSAVLSTPPLTLSLSPEGERGLYFLLRAHNLQQPATLVLYLVQQMTHSKKIDVPKVIILGTIQVHLILFATKILC